MAIKLAIPMCLSLQVCNALKYDVPDHTPPLVSHTGNVWGLIDQWKPGREDSKNSGFLPQCPAGTDFSVQRFRVASEEFVPLPPNAKGLTDGVFRAVVGQFGLHGCCPTTLVYPTDFNYLELMKRWSNKTVYFFGDSLTNEVVDAVHIVAHMHNLTLPYIDHGFKIQEYNITIFFHGGGHSARGGCIAPLPTGEDLNVVANWKHNKSDWPTDTEVFEHDLAKSDISYTNVGLHLKVNDSEARKEFKYIRGALERDMARHPWKKHFYRLTFPQHFAGEDGTGVAWRDGIRGSCVGQGVKTAEHYTSRIAREAFAGSKVQVLDYQDFFSKRGDLHTRDCSHFCWNAEVWKGVLMLMARALDS